MGKAQAACAIRPDPSHSVFPRAETKRDKEHLMLDFFMLALGLGFFAAAIGYTYACERL